MRHGALILLIFAVLALATGGAEGAKPPLEIVGSSWTGAVLEKLSVQKVGKDVFLNAISVNIPSAGQWTSSDIEGYNFSGTYTPKGSSGFIFTYDTAGRAELVQAIEDWIEEMLAFEGQFFSVTVQIVRVKAMVKVKAKKGVMSAAKTKISVAFTATGDGRTVKGKLKQKGVLLP